jgi:hypothetical protein
MGNIEQSLEFYKHFFRSARGNITCMEKHSTFATCYLVLVESIKLTKNELIFEKVLLIMRIFQ